MGSELEQIKAELNALGELSAAPTPIPVAAPVPSGVSPVISSSPGITQQDVISGLKTTGSISANLAGSLVGAEAGAAAGAPLAPFTFGLSVPIGGILGGALGGFGADVGYQAVSNLAENQQQPLEKFISPAAEQARVGALLETGLRGAAYLAPSTVRLVGKSVAGIGSKLSDLLISKSATEAKTIAADTLEKLGATVPQLEAAVKTLPKDKTATLYDALPTKEIAQAQDLLSRTSAGAQPLSDVAVKQTEQIRSTFDKLIPTKLKDLTTEEIGTELKRAYETLRDPAFEKAGANYTKEILKAKVPVKGLKKSVDEYLVKNFGQLEAVPSPIMAAANKIKSILPSTGQAAEQKAMGFGVELATKSATRTPKTVPLQALQEVRSELLKNVRATKDWGTQHHIVELVQKITDTLGTSQQGKELIAANTAYKDMIDKWFRSDLAKAMDKPATDIIKNLSKGAAPVKQFEETFGKLTPTKGKLSNTPAELFVAGKNKEFALKRDPASISDWVAKNENALKRTGLWPSFEGLIQEGEKAAKYGIQAGTKGMQKQTVEAAKLAKPVRDVFGRYAGDIADETTTGKALGSQLATMIRGAVRPITQRMINAPISGGITTSILGAGGSALGGIPIGPAALIAGPVAGVGAQIVRVAQKNEAEVGKQLVKAFTDPKYAAKLLKEKAQQEAAKKALEATRQVTYEKMREAGIQTMRDIAQSPLVTPLNRGILAGQQLQSIPTNIGNSESDAIDRELAALGE